MSSAREASRPTLGVEVELAFFAPGHAVGRQSPLPGMLLRAAAGKQRCVPAARRFGFFSPSGLTYQEMDRYLEASSWPADRLDAALAAEEAILEHARRMAELAGLDTGRFAAACYPDDMAGVPLSRLEQVPDPENIPALSSSMGTHVNLHITREVREVGELFVMLACALTDVVGPGGMVRNPDNKKLEFWRDPRAAHLFCRKNRSAHARRRPVLKTTDNPRRIQLVNFGWTASRIDRLIKYGLFMLLASYVDRTQPLPGHRISQVRTFMHAEAGKELLHWRDDKRKRSSKVDILEFLLDSILEPEAESEEGKALGCGPAIAWARTAIAALRSESDAAEIARRFPSSWAIKQHVFTHALSEVGSFLPVYGVSQTSRRSAAKEEQLAKLGLLCILESNILDHGVKRWLLAEIEGAPWSYGEVYEPDEEAIASVDQERHVRGCTHPAEEICRYLEESAQDSGGERPERRTLVDWYGVRHAERGAGPDLAAELAAEAEQAASATGFAGRLRAIRTRLRRGRRDEEGPVT